MNFNSYLFKRGERCVAVDPLPLDAASMDELERLGGVSAIVLTNRDHERGAQMVRERFESRVLAHEPEASLFNVHVDGTFKDGDEVFADAFAIALPSGKTAGEVALHFPRLRTALVGDALIGAPAGSVSLLPQEKLQDRNAFLFSLRRLWALQLKTLLLCDGQPLFSSADEAITELLETTAGAAINRINADEIRYEYSRDRPGYGVDDGEVGLLIGARKLGYRLAKLDPGHAFCPLHWHVQCEEFFYVVEGHPSIRTSRGTIECRPGDFIAFPTGERGAHQSRNDSGAPCLVLLVGMEDAAVDFESCFYPDSEKVGLWTGDGPLCMVRSSPDLDYWDRE
jgi:uncharacterized cupin superfamily protein